MRSIAGLAVVLGVGALLPADAPAQMLAERRWGVSGSIRGAQSVQHGAVLSIVAPSSQPLSVRLDGGVYFHRADPPAVYCGFRCAPAHHARENWASTLELMVEARRRRSGVVTWFAVVGGGAVAVRTKVFDGRTLAEVPPSTEWAALSSAGFGREFRALGGRNRVEVRWDRNHFPVDNLDGGRLLMTRVW